MPTLWKRWKSKSRIPTVPTGSWKSRKGGEIPTFPQLLLFGLVYTINNYGGRTVCGGKVEIQKQDSHFPTAPMACGARKKILKVSTMCPVRCVYHVPVLTGTRADARGIAWLRAIFSATNISAVQCLVSEPVENILASGVIACGAVSTGTFR